MGFLLLLRSLEGLGFSLGDRRFLPVFLNLAFLEILRRTVLNRQMRGKG